MIPFIIMTLAVGAILTVIYRWTKGCAGTMEPPTRCRNTPDEEEKI